MLCLIGPYVKYQGVLGVGEKVRSDKEACSGTVHTQCLCHVLKVNDKEKVEENSCKALKSPMVFHFFYDFEVTLAVKTQSPLKGHKS